MTDLPPGEYTVTGPNGFSFTGGLNQAMELLPDTVARRQAVEDMYRAEKHKQDAEQRLAELQAQCAEAEVQRDEALAIRDEAITNARQLVEDANQVADSIGSASKAHAEQQEAERLAEIAEQLAPIAGPDGKGEQTLAASDDGDLEANPPVDRERYGPNERDDQEPAIKPPLAYPTVPTSYGNTPESWVKKKDSGDPLPFDPASPGEVDIPPPGPDPGSLDYPPRPQIAQPTAISMHGE
jgi:hypothetical protein